MGKGLTTTIQPVTTNGKDVSTYAQPGREIPTAAWLDYLMRRRHVLIMDLGILEDILIEYDRLYRRSIIPSKDR